MVVFVAQNSCLLLPFGAVTFSQADNCMTHALYR